MNFKSIFKFKTEFFLVCFFLYSFYLIGCGGGGGGNAVQNDSPTTTVDSGMTIYVVGYHPQQPELGGVAAINSSSGTVTYLFRGPGDFQDISVSPDGRYVIFSEYNSGAIFFYEIETDTLLQGQTKAGAFGVAITSDSAYSLVVSTNVEPTLALCDLIALTIEEIDIVPTPTGSGSFGPPRHIVLTPDDSAAYITTGSYNHTTGYIAKATETAQGEFNFEPIHVGGDPSRGLAMFPSSTRPQMRWSIRSKPEIWLRTLLSPLMVKRLMSVQAMFT